MLLIGIALAVVVVLLAIAEIRLRKQDARLKKIEQELGMWKYAARHIAEDNERMARELMS